MLDTQPIYIELSDEADQFYLVNVDLENASPHGFYCRILRPKAVERRTYRIDLNRLEAFRYQ